MLKEVLVFLHVLTAAAWFGMALRLSKQARKASSLDGAAAAALADEAVESVRLVGIFILLTFAFAMGILVLGGGYAGEIQYHVASMLIFVLVILHYVVVQPAAKSLRTAVETGSDKVSPQRRVVIAGGIGHLLWVVILGLMFWNRFAGVT